MRERNITSPKLEKQIEAGMNSPKKLLE